MSTFNQIVQVSQATTSAPQVMCSLPTTGAGSQYQDIKRIIYWTIELDGSLIATAALVVAVQTYNLAKLGYFAPSTPAWNAISIAVGTKQVLTYTGPLAGIQIFISTFGTSTGTFFAQILGSS